MLRKKGASAPKEHSKGRMDVIGWNFVMYNSEQVRLRLWCVLGDGFWLTSQNALKGENKGFRYLLRRRHRRQDYGGTTH
nr:hypothetical protein [Tanacetum cinerariifolium]